MNNLNYEFFDEYKSLDNLCRDIYGPSNDNKLGVTLYLEDMDNKSYLGSYLILGWMSDYKQLKQVRNTRNELAHSPNSFSYELCTEEDIEFVRSFRERILNQTDPIAQLRQKSTQPYHSSENNDSYHVPHSHPTYSYNKQRTAPPGCLGIVALFLIVSVLIISILT